MLEDTKVYAFPSLELAKTMAGALHKMGYTHVHVYGEVGAIDPQGRLPANTKYMVIATSKGFAKFTDDDFGG